MRHSHQHPHDANMYRPGYSVPTFNHEHEHEHNQSARDRYDHGPLSHEHEHGQQQEKDAAQPSVDRTG